jgi:rhodanese-related sulfurtransferase
MRLLPLIILVSAPLLFAEAPPPPQARELAPDEVQKLITERKDIGILDVRTIEEITDLGRLPGARHLDFFREDFAVTLPKLALDPAKPCVVYCALGGRAKRAAVTLAAAGFKDIILPSGGYNAWKRAGKPCEGGK